MADVVSSTKNDSEKGKNISIKVNFFLFMYMNHMDNFIFIEFEQQPHLILRTMDYRD